MASTLSLARPISAAIEQREALLHHLPGQLGDALDLGLGAQLQRHQVLRARADAVADVVACHHQVLAAIVPTAHDHMGVGMAGVEMIDGDPIQLGAEIALHLLHEIADDGLQVCQPFAVLGGHDEAELMRVMLGALEEGLAVGVIAGSVIEPTGIALARDAVALDVAQVRTRRAELARPSAACSVP